MAENPATQSLETSFPPPSHEQRTEDRSVRIAFETARLELAQLYDETVEARTSAYRIACKHSAQTLQVARVSVWFLSEDAEVLECALSYNLPTDEFTSGAQLLRRGCPKYFQAIRSRRVVVAHDALRDEKTRELEGYLTNNGITSLLDAPIYRNGQVVGVVCHEHVGPQRTWTEKEAGFASAVSDMLTILGQQAERAELQAVIAAQKQLEAQNQKMQALTKLGLVVIHDLSNIMTIVGARAELLEEETDLRQAADDLREALRYGNTLLRQLRDFYNEREPTAGVNATEVLRGLEPSLRALLGKEIELSFSCPSESVTLGLTRIELEQLVMNLCLNARDALSGRSDPKVVVRATLDVGRLILIVSDNGVGMSESTQARIFEPYYSTKSGHSGVGLAAVFGIVSRAKGQIEVQSAPEPGTTFKLTFPLESAEVRDSFEPPWSLGY
jgi:two-component system cell cycle sensor histidine kinase/response regulator CckA